MERLWHLEQDIIESCTFIEPHPIVHTWHRTGSGTPQSKSTEKRVPLTIALKLYLRSQISPET